MCGGETDTSVCVCVRACVCVCGGETDTSDNYCTQYDIGLSSRYMYCIITNKKCPYRIIKKESIYARIGHGYNVVEGGKAEHIGTLG